MIQFKKELLGILQGVTEFLPISSSGHLLLTESILNLDQKSLAFAIFVHGATLLSMLVFFSKDFRQIQQIKKNKDLLFKIAVASLPIAVCGIFLRSFIEQIQSNQLVGYGFLSTGLLFLLVLVFKKGREKTLEALSFKQALWIGSFQALALLPGFSRSGWTIAIALIMGFSAKSSYYFSFMLAFPAILGAFILESLNPSVSFSSEWIGAFFAAFGAGILSLYFLLFILKKQKLYFFSFYLVPLGLYLLLF